MRRELLPMLKLAGPVVMAEIGWMSMGIVDTIMVGPLGPAAIGAAGMSSSLFLTVAISGMGLLLGLDALVAQAYGARRLDECVRWLQHGVFIALTAGPVVMLVFYALLATLDRWGLHPEVRALAAPYLRVVAVSTIPLFLYAVFRRYLQGIHVVRPVMLALITANVVNAAGNWILIYGNLGAPRLGITGAAWATIGARIYLAAFLGLAIALEHRRLADAFPRVLPSIDRTRLRRLLGLGIPAAGQVALEYGVFAAVSALAGKLDPVSLAAHQIALNVAALAFMVPLGLSSAGAVRVGHALGARDPARATHAGWIALAGGAAIMTAVGILFLIVPAPILSVFTSDRAVIAVGVRLLAIAAAFQLFDGTQAVATGVLRGTGDTRTPLTINVVGHWGLGLPAGYALCFWAGYGVAGLWIGLCLGLTAVAVLLMVVWRRTSLSLTAQQPVAQAAAAAERPVSAPGGPRRR